MAEGNEKGMKNGNEKYGRRESKRKEKPARRE
jgi:hypothetical protein